MKNRFLVCVALVVVFFHSFICAHTVPGVVAGRQYRRSSRLQRFKEFLHNHRRTLIAAPSGAALGALMTWLLMRERKAPRASTHVTTRECGVSADLMADDAGNAKRIPRVNEGRRQSWTSTGSMGVYVPPGDDAALEIVEKLEGLNEEQGRVILGQELYIRSLQRRFDSIMSMTRSLRASGIADKAIVNGILRDQFV